MVIQAVRKPTASEVVFHNSKKKIPSENKTNTAPIKQKPKKRNNRSKNEESEEENEGKKQFLSLKQAKFDVFKFGIKGFSKEEQESANIKLAIKLGAAAPKNKTMNYKELMDLKKEEKNKLDSLKKENKQFEAKIAMAHSNLSAYKKKKAKHPNSNSQRKAKISKGDVGLIKGHIGSFSNGVLKIKNNVIKRLKS